MIILVLYFVGLVFAFFYGVYKYGQDENSTEALVCMLGCPFWPFLIPISIVYNLGQKNAK